VRTATAGTERSGAEEGAAYTRTRAMRAPRNRIGIAVAALVGALSLACSGANVTRTAGPATSSDEFGSDVPVRVTATAVKPSLLHLFEGLQATFVNEDTVPRTLAVDAARSDQAGCSAVSLVLQPGERRTTPTLPRFAVCYFVDAQRPADTAFQGAVVTH
jgi:hypothetical protein